MINKVIIIKTSPRCIHVKILFGYPPHPLENIRNPVQSLMIKTLDASYRAVRAELLQDDPPTVIKLPRGGYYIKMTGTPVQVGLPPETIKDCMNLKLDLPRYDGSRRLSSIYQ